MPPKKQVTKEVPQQLQGWMDVVAEVRAMYPRADYKEILMKAKPIYHKMKAQMGLGKKRR